MMMMTRVAIETCDGGFHTEGRFQVMDSTDVKLTQGQRLETGDGTNRVPDMRRVVEVDCC